MSSSGSDDRVDVLEEHDPLVHGVRPVDGGELLVVGSEVARRVEELLRDDRGPQPRRRPARAARRSRATSPPRSNHSRVARHVELDDELVLELQPADPVLLLGRRRTSPASWGLLGVGPLEAVDQRDHRVVPRASGRRPRRPSAAMPPLRTSTSVRRRASTSWSMLGLCPNASSIASSTGLARVARQRRSRRRRTRPAPRRSRRSTCAPQARVGADLARRSARSARPAGWSPR